MYKAWSLNILNALILMNLVALSSLTWYVQTDGQFDVTVPLLSVMKRYNYVYVAPLSEHRYAGEGLLQRLQIRVAELLPMPGCQTTWKYLYRTSEFENSDSNAETQNLLQPHEDQLEQMQHSLNPGSRINMCHVDCTSCKAVQSYFPCTIQIQQVFRGWKMRL